MVPTWSPRSRMRHAWTSPGSPAPTSLSARARGVLHPTAGFAHEPDGDGAGQQLRHDVAIRVVLTPDNGSSSSYDTNIDNSTINPASVTVPVVLPVNVQVQVNAWTR